MEALATIKLKEPIEVVGADIGDDPGPFEDVYQIEVFKMKNALASGCPAYIIINGRKYRV